MMRNPPKSHRWSAALLLLGTVALGSPFAMLRAQSLPGPQEATPAEPAANSLEARVRRDASCGALSDGCQICVRQGADRVACSTPGIACQPTGWQCKQAGSGTSDSQGSGTKTP